MSLTNDHAGPPPGPDQAGRLLARGETRLDAGRRAARECGHAGSYAEDFARGYAAEWKLGRNDSRCLNDPDLRPADAAAWEAGWDEGRRRRARITTGRSLQGRISARHR